VLKLPALARSAAMGAVRLARPPTHRGPMHDAALRSLCQRHGIPVPARITGESTVREAVRDYALRTFTWSAIVAHFFCHWCKTWQWQEFLQPRLKLATAHC